MRKVFFVFLVPFVYDKLYPNMKRLFAVILLLMVAYVASYVWFRWSHVERWERDDRDYVIFPQSAAIYYFYRPLTYLDACITGMRFHIGPHRP